MSSLARRSLRTTAAAAGIAALGVGGAGHALAQEVPGVSGFDPFSVLGVTGSPTSAGMLTNPLGAPAMGQTADLPDAFAFDAPSFTTQGPSQGEDSESEGDGEGASTQDSGSEQDATTTQGSDASQNNSFSGTFELNQETTQQATQEAAGGTMQNVTQQITGAPDDGLGSLNGIGDGEEPQTLIGPRVGPLPEFNDINFIVVPLAGPAGLPGLNLPNTNGNNLDFSTERLPISEPRLMENTEPTVDVNTLPTFDTGMLTPSGS